MIDRTPYLFILDTGERAPVELDMTLDEARKAFANQRVSIRKDSSKPVGFGNSRLVFVVAIEEN